MRQPVISYTKRVYFPNGYGLSITCRNIPLPGGGKFASYGGDAGRFEILPFEWHRDGEPFCHDEMASHLDFIDVAEMIEKYRKMETGFYKYPPQDYKMTGTSHFDA